MGRDGKAKKKMKRVREKGKSKKILKDRVKGGKVKR